MILEEKWEREYSKFQDDLWQQNRELERGNEERCYEGPKFKLRL